MTQRTITALFDTRSDASEAIEQLVKAGIPRTSARMMPDTDPGAAGQRSSASAANENKSFWDSLSDFFMPDEDRHTYAEAMNRGGILVAVTVDEAHSRKAEAILEDHGTVDLDEREASWRSEGWPGYDADAQQTAQTGTETIPIVEEELKVGKRQVSGGTVKLRSYVVETPVTEEVNLRSESVQVERRPVNRAVKGNADFRDRTIEAQATSEEAVVSKDARVKEELVLKKSVGRRTETVSDTVRATKVDIKDETAKPSKRAR